jgi:antitoxin StbD
MYIRMHIQEHAMATLYTRQIATITELREPQKVLDRAGGKPVAILKNSQPVAYVVPVEHLETAPAHRPATMEELRASLERTRERAQPVLDYLRDK